ncbi:MAG: NAD(P)/FAD-dependent oxidoreductase, partial [Actinomycetota bacterium]
MTDTPTHTIERRCDVLVIGGSAAGLAAALQLGRQRRSVIVVDAGEPRNGPAAHMHGFLGRDGTPPADLTAAGRDEVRRYGVEVLDGRVVDVEPTGDGLCASIVGGHSVTSRAVVVATGLVDRLPEIDGVAEQWGRGVLHCPFCHGYEVRDQRIVQLVTHPMALHATPMLRQLTDDLKVVVTDDVLGALDDPDTELDVLTASGVSVVRSDVAAVRVDEHERISHVELPDGTRLPADAVVVAPEFIASTDVLRGVGLGATPHPTGLGTALTTDEFGQTEVPGVWAAGNVTDPMQQVLQAAANGGFVGAMVARQLAATDLDDGRRDRPGEAEWDRRYGGDRVWSGNPNGALVAEARALTPGRALDVGAGEGG